MKKNALPENLNHKLTEYFTVRKSDRRTKREVQEERKRLFEFALRKGVEDGLEVKRILNQILLYKCYIFCR